MAFADMSREDEEFSPEDMEFGPEEQGEAPPRPRIQRTRARRESFNVDAQEIVRRVLDFRSDDLASRATDMENRLQRMAKYRQWTGGREGLWDDASDIAIPDMMTDSMRVQDTLHNAVMAIRPAVQSIAVDKVDADKQVVIDNLVDYQVFEEQDGETAIGEIVESFVNDGVFTAFIPWVEEFKRASEVRLLDPIPPDVDPILIFVNELSRLYPGATANPKAGRARGWDWTIKREGEADIEASFYTRSDGRVEMVSVTDVEVFNGPRIIVKGYDEVLHPPDAGNLQAPGPSNPAGSPHVILVDRPTVAEVLKLADRGYYDLLRAEERERLENTPQSAEGAELSDQTASFQGLAENTEPRPIGHRRLTRLTCFDLYDIDGDGNTEDVVWTVLLEPELLIKARRLTEVYPSNPPRRPFAEASFMPVRGRRAGISLLEMMEGLHDATKQTLDQMIDAGTFQNSPFFFYRPHGSMKPEVIRLFPGEGYPLSDPSRDVFFPQFNNSSQAFGINLLTLLNQFKERLTMVGDLQLGRVPQGRSSALRTIGGQAIIAGQAEARPERILRRFMLGIRAIWEHIHQLNQYRLPENKKILLAGYHGPKDDPYFVVPNREAISGKFKFRFQANALNTSRAMMQQALMQMMATYVSPLAIQLGISTPDTIYRLFRDFGKANGQDPEKSAYINPPTPQAAQPVISFEDVITIISNGTMPRGLPMEGAQAQLQKIQEFVNSDDMGYLPAGGGAMLRQYVENVLAPVLQQEMRQQAILQAAGQFGGQFGAQGGGQGGVGVSEMAQGNPQVNENELIDETLPGAR